MSEFGKGETPKGGKTLVDTSKPTTSAILHNERLINNYKREHSYCDYSKKVVIKRIRLGKKTATAKKPVQKKKVVSTVTDTTCEELIVTDNPLTSEIVIKDEIDTNPVEVPSNQIIVPEKKKCFVAVPSNQIIVPKKKKPLKCQRVKKLKPYKVVSTITNATCKELIVIDNRLTSEVDKKDENKTNSVVISNDQTSNRNDKTYLRVKNLTQLNKLQKVVKTAAVPTDKTAAVPTDKPAKRPEARRVYVPKKTQKPEPETEFIDISAENPGTSASELKIEEDDSIVVSSEDEDDIGEPRLISDQDLLRKVDVSEIYLTDILEKQKLSTLELSAQAEKCFKTYYAFRKCGLKNFINEVSGVSILDVKIIGEPVVLNTFNNFCVITINKLEDSKFLIMFEEKTFKTEVDKGIYLDFITKIYQYDIPNNKEIRLYYLLEDNGSKSPEIDDGFRELNATKALEILSSKNYPRPTEYKYKKFHVNVHPIAYPKNVLERSEHFRQKRTYLFQFTYPLHTNVLMQNLKEFHLKIVNQILDKVTFIKTYYKIRCKPIISNFYEHTLISVPPEKKIHEDIFKSLPILKQTNIGGILKLSVYTLGKDYYLIEFVGLTTPSRLTHVRALRKLFAVKEKDDKGKIIRDCIMVPGVCIVCQYEFLTQWQYFKHKDETGHSQQMRKCSFCKEILSNEDTLRNHLIDVHLSKEFDCVKCKKLKQHRVLCSGHTKEFICGDKVQKEDTVAVYDVVEEV